MEPTSLGVEIPRPLQAIGHCLPRNKDVAQVAASVPHAPLARLSKEISCSLDVGFDPDSTPKSNSPRVAPLGPTVLAGPQEQPGCLRQVPIDAESIAINNSKVVATQPTSFAAGALGRGAATLQVPLHTNALHIGIRQVATGLSKTAIARTHQQGDPDLGRLICVEDRRALLATRSRVRALWNRLTAVARRKDQIPLAFSLAHALAAHDHLSIGTIRHLLSVCSHLLACGRLHRLGAHIRHRIRPLHGHARGHREHCQRRNPLLHH
jgi:hypothetical protein